MILTATLNPWAYVGIFIAAIFVLVVGLSFLISLAVAIAGRVVSDRNADKYQKELCGMLPGKDCGQCGCEDCAGFARSVYYGAVAEDACPYGDEDLPQRMLACVNRMHESLVDPTPPKDKKDRILGVWDKKRD